MANRAKLDLGQGMEIRNTATERDLEWLDTPELLSQLQVALRNVALYEGYNALEPPDDTMVKWVEVVQRIHALLMGRGAAFGPELDVLSAQTGWMLGQLMEDCLKWPACVPFVRDLDGVRRKLRCCHCHRREFPLDTAERLCDECLLEMIERIALKRPSDAVLLFRTYNASRWCPHADAETVLMTFDEYDFLADGRCVQCLQAEYDRRHRATV